MIVKAYGAQASDKPLENTDGDIPMVTPSRFGKRVCQHGTNVLASALSVDCSAPIWRPQRTSRQAPGDARAPRQGHGLPCDEITA